MPDHDFTPESMSKAFYALCCDRIDFKQTML